MIVSQQRQLGIIDRPINIDYGSHSRIRRLVRPGVVDQESASRFADDRDLRNIHMVFCGVGLDPADGAVHILNGLRKTELGSHPVVDAEPRKSGSGQWFKSPADINALAALVEPA